MSDDDDTRELGIFPLGLVVLPGERVPLHIFEPRYRALVADCTLQSRPFVISLAGERGVARIGCEVRLDELTRRFSDGRMNVVVGGERRVELVEQTAGAPYVTAAVRDLPDEDSPPDTALEDAVRDGLRRLAEAVAGAPLAPDAPPGVPLSYAVASALDLDPLVKQHLLEDRAEPSRLQAVAELIDDSRTGLHRREVAAERAKTNGKVTLS